jgi:PAS domain S-box-containing protein
MAPGSTRGERGQEWAEADWRLVSESIPHVVWVAGPDGQTLYFNRRGEDYSGTSGEALAWEEIVHPDDLHRSTECWLLAQRTQTLFQEDIRLRRADGVYRWHSSRSQPVLGADGAIERWFGTATDIDDRKQVEERLVVAEREARQVLTLLETLHAAAPVGFGFVDRDARIVRLNQEMAELAGLPIEDLVGRTVPEVVPELWGTLEPIFRHVLDVGAAIRNLPLARPPSQGRTGHREWLANFYPVRIDDEIVGVGVVGVDVTERIQAEGFRSTVMSQVADGVYTQDLEGRLLYMNRAASKMLGWTEDELRGRCVHDVVHFQRADGTPVGREECALLTQGPDRRLVQVAGEVFTRKDGTVFPVAYTSMPLRVGSRTEGASVVFRDISDPTTSTNLIRVLIADADRTSSDALAAMLTRHEGLEVVSVVTTTAAAIEQARRLRPDVVLVDIALPEFGGPASTMRIKAEAPATSVILLATDYDDAVAAGAIAAGCSGIVDKRRAWVELASAVRVAYHGETNISQAELQQVVTKVRDSWQPGRAQDLTAREREVLLCLTQGLTNRQAATRLGVTLNTVRNHVQRILYKLDVHSRLEAVVLATSTGILDDVG